MQAITNPFANIINGPKQFVIPVFQRDYAWGPEQCDRMWSDVLKAAIDDAPHFLGSFVYVDEQVGAVLRQLAGHRRSTATYDLDTSDDRPAGSFG